MSTLTLIAVPLHQSERPHCVIVRKRSTQETSLTCINMSLFTFILGNHLRIYERLIFGFAHLAKTRSGAGLVDVERGT